jgi:cell division inhibitor SulA/protein ImuA
VLAREGIGEIRLTLPALTRLQAAGRDVVWIMPPHVPYAPALAGRGLDLARLVLVRCKNVADQLWAYEQALRAPECGAAFAWLGPQHDRALRRLAVAAREGHTWGVLWQRPGQQAVAAAAPLRLALAPQDGQLSVQVQKRRGGDVAKPILLDVEAAPALPDRPNTRPDRRTSAGYDIAERKPSLRPIRSAH